MDGEKYEKESRMGSLLAEKTVYHCRHAGNPCSSRQTVLYSRGQEQERKQLEQEIAAEMDTENQNVAMEEETEADQVASILKPQTQSTETAEVEKESEEADSGQEEVAPTGNTSQALHFAAEDGILWPMEGNVILDYSMDSTVYFATLDQYKYNPAVIIAGDVNSKVYAVAKGKIQSIETNEVTGCTVTEDFGRWVSRSLRTA